MTIRGAQYKRREGDDYPTPAYVTQDLLNMIGKELDEIICDPAPGPKRAIIKALQQWGKTAIDNGRSKDFINDWRVHLSCDILTNPPYGAQGKLAIAFIEKALAITRSWNGSVVMLLPFDFDAAKTRRYLFTHPAFECKIVLPYRIEWFKGGTSGSSLNHAWSKWNWDNGKKTFTAPTIRYMLPTE